MIRFLVMIRRAQVTYPLTLVWLTGCLVAIGVSLTWFELGVGLVILSSISLMVYMISLRLHMVGLQLEVKQVHTLVNSQRDELLERINVLVDALVSAGVSLPDGETTDEAQVQPSKERQ